MVVALGCPVPVDVTGGLPQSNIITTASRPSTCMSFDHMSGVIPPLIFVLLLEGKANLRDCGQFTMPSSEAMAQAPPDVITRFESVKEVNLSGMENLAGGSCRYVAC